MNSIYYVNDVFTPTSPARSTYVERQLILERLVNAIRTPGKQIVVYGHSGSGKTTLLVNKLYQLYEDHITTRCVNGMTFEQIILNAFDQLNVFYDSEKVQANKKSLNQSITLEYSVIKAKLDAQIATERQVKQQRFTPPQLTPQALAKFLGRANCCWVLEDFHKIDPQEKKRVAQVMKLFMDMSVEYDSLKIIAIGVADTARQVVEYDSEMRHRVAEIYVPLMTGEEIQEIVKKGVTLLNFTLKPRTVADIVKYSNGLASVAHQLCLDICYSAGIQATLAESVEISKKDLQKAIRIFSENSSDTLKSSFDKALRQERRGRFNNAKLILEALTQCDQNGGTKTDIHYKILEKKKEYPYRTLTTWLDRLQSEERGALVVFDSNSGKYSFKDPMYRTYALTYFSNEENDEINHDRINNVNSIFSMLSKMIRS